MIVVSLVAASMGAFFAFAVATVLYEHKNARLQAEADRKVDLTIKGLNRYGMIGVPIETVGLISEIINDRTPGMTAHFDEDAGTIFFEEEIPNDYSDAPGISDGENHD